MAKLSARGAHKVGQVTANRFYNAERTEGARYLFALRSDGKVLYRTTRIYDPSYWRTGGFFTASNGYTIYATLKPSGPTFGSLDVTRLAEILRRKGYELV